MTHRNWFLRCHVCAFVRVKLQACPRGERRDWDWAGTSQRWEDYLMMSSVIVSYIFPLQHIFSVDYYGIHGLNCPFCVYVLILGTETHKGLHSLWRMLFTDHLMHIVHKIVWIVGATFSYLVRSFLFFSFFFFFLFYFPEYATRFPLSLKAWTFFKNYWD